MNQTHFYKLKIKTVATKSRSPDTKPFNSNVESKQTMVLNSSDPVNEICY